MKNGMVIDYIDYLTYLVQHHPKRIRQIRKLMEWNEVEKGANA